MPAFFLHGSSSSNSESDDDAQGQDSRFPEKPSCDELVTVQLESDQDEVRPNMRVADLLAPISKPIPIRLEPDGDNGFSLNPSLDDLSASIHVEYDGGAIEYGYWKQPNHWEKSSGKQGADPGCEDKLSMSAQLKLRSKSGDLDESIFVYLDARFSAGRPIDLSRLVVGAMVEPDELSALPGKFQMGKPSLAPGDVVGEQYYELFARFVGETPKGRLGALQEVIVKGSDAVGPDRPVVHARFHFKVVE